MFNQCVEFEYSLHLCVGSLRAHRFPPTVQKHWVGLTDGSVWTTGASMSVHECLSLGAKMDWQPVKDVNYHYRTGSCSLGMRTSE